MLRTGVLSTRPFVVSMLLDMLFWFENARAESDGYGHRSRADAVLESNG